MTEQNWTVIGETTVLVHGRMPIAHPSLEDAVRVERWRVLTIVAALESGMISSDIAEFDIGTVWSGSRLHGPCLITFRDEMGMNIPAWRIVEAFRSMEAERSRFHAGPRYAGPVPGTGVSHWGGWRAMRTSQELADNAHLERDDDAKFHGIRSRGRRRNLPTVYDDVWVEGERSWKRHRRTQWRG